LSGGFALKLLLGGCGCCFCPLYQEQLVPRRLTILPQASAVAKDLIVTDRLHAYQM